MISIEHKQFLEDMGAWHVQAHMDLGTGSRRCTHVIKLPASATDDEIKAAILAMYES